MKELYFYGSSVQVSPSSNCYSEDLCGTSEYQGCKPFTCSCPLETVYVKKDYSGTTSFGGKEVTFKKVL